LKYLKPVVMVRFQGESHELSRSGQPWHRIERLQHIVGWFEKYLQGKKTETYQASGFRLQASREPYDALRRAPYA
jgi:hypothetical protein